MTTTKEEEREFRFSAPELRDGGRRRELQSLVGGSSRLMTGALTRLESYLGFLEDELEGNARAEDFLREGGQLVARLRSLLGLLDGPACGGVSQAGDVLRLPTLFHGLLERCRKLSGAVYEWRCDGEPQTCGELFSLQQVLFEMLLAAGRGGVADAQVAVTVEEGGGSRGRAGRWRWGGCGRCCRVRSLRPWRRSGAAGGRCRAGWGFCVARAASCCRRVRGA